MEIMVLVLILFMGSSAKKKKKINWGCAVLWYRLALVKKKNLNSAS